MIILRVVLTSSLVVLLAFAASSAWAWLPFRGGAPSVVVSGNLMTDGAGNLMSDGVGNLMADH